MLAIADGVERAECSRGGLAGLAAAYPWARECSAELVDAAGQMCGRIRHCADPAAARYGPGLVWHCQIGGVLSESAWRATPMGCGAGDSPYAAAHACADDLRARAEALLRQASRIEAML